MAEQPSHKKKTNVYETYRRVLDMHGLTDAEIDEIRIPFILLAQAICEHVWGQKFY